MVRSVQANIFRSGSLLLNFVTGDKLDIEYLTENPDSQYRRITWALQILQSTYALAAGLFILCVYLQLGRCKLQQGDLAPEVQTRDSSLNNTPAYSLIHTKTASVSQQEPGKSTSMSLQRSLLIQMHQKDLSVVRNRSAKSSGVAILPN